MATERESLAAIRNEVRRERRIDMDERMRRYRYACFAILAVAVAAFAPTYGWAWMLLLFAGFTVFPIAERMVRGTSSPGFRYALAWAALPVMLGVAVATTGGADSPVLMWFALPAVSLGARFERPGIIAGTAFVIVVMLSSVAAAGGVPDAAEARLVVAAVAVVICTAILCGALVESDWTYRRRSTVDQLTGLFNRTALDQRLGELDAGQDQEPGAGSDHGDRGYAVLYCDLDNFKLVNDRHGHAAGDAVLRDVAYTMRGTLRSGDQIYRVGGEEILVVLPGAERGEATEIAERIRVAVRQRRPGGIPVTVSVGIAVSRGGLHGSHDLIARADAALYAAKAGGRDRVVFGRVDLEPTQASLN